jgi:hypothetical protein
MLDDGHAGVGDDGLDEGVAAARDDEIDVLVHLRHVCLTASRSVRGMSRTLSAGRPASAAPAWRASAMARFEWMDSEPPRRMVALPVLVQRTAASLVTLGRDS